VSSKGAYNLCALRAGKAERLDHFPPDTAGS
jgi:hypothetical protein